MKRLTLFVSALALAVATFAVPHAKVVKNQHEPNFKVGQAELENAQAPIKVKAAGIDTVLVPYTLITPDFKTATTYRVGKPSDGFAYNYYQQGLITPYMPSVIFVNDSMRPATWLVDGSIVAEDTPLYPMELQFGDNPMPLMQTPCGADSLILDYQISGLWVKDQTSTNYYSAINVAPAEYMPLTRCAMYTEDPREDEGGQDYWMMGAGSIGSYAYGTNLANPWDGGTFDTIFVPFYNDGHMVIDHMTLAIYNSLQGTSADIFPAETDHVRLTVFPVNNAAETWFDYVDWANPIATAVATIDDFTPYYEGYTWLGMLQFNFMQIDEATGAETPGEIEVDGDFIIALSEYNDGTANFGIFTDGAALNGQTKLVGHDAEGSYATGLWKSPGNILLNVVAYMPAFAIDEEIAFAEGETEKVIEVPSNVWDEDIAVEADDWIDVAIETQSHVEEDEGEQYDIHEYINKVTITLTEETATREGTILFDAYGAQVTVKVRQNVQTGVENVSFKNDGKLYNVLGIEVGEDYKGVVIRNGQKFVR